MTLAPGKKLRFLGKHASERCDEAEVDLIKAGPLTYERKGNTIRILKTVKLRIDRNGSTPSFEIIDGI